MTDTSTEAVERHARLCVSWKRAAYGGGMEWAGDAAALLRALAAERDALERDKAEWRAIAMSVWGRRPDIAAILRGEAVAVERSLLEGVVLCCKQGDTGGARALANKAIAASPFAAKRDE